MIIAPCSQDHQATEDTLSIPKDPFEPTVLQLTDRINQLISALFTHIKDSVIQPHHIDKLTKTPYTENLLVSKDKEKKMRFYSFCSKKFIIFKNLQVGIGGTKKIYAAIDINDIEGKYMRGMVAVYPKDKEDYPFIRLEMKAQEILCLTDSDRKYFGLFEYCFPPIYPEEGPELLYIKFWRIKTVCFSYNAGNQLQIANYYSSRGGLPAIVHIFTCLAEDLTILHKKGFAHNDIRPENILVSAGEPTLIDFGLLERFGEQTSCSRIIAPPEYPGDDLYESDPSGDIWAFGAVLFMCLSNEKSILRSSDWKELISNRSLSQESLNSFVRTHIPDTQQYCTIISILRMNRDERPPAHALKSILERLIHPPESEPESSVLTEKTQSSSVSKEV